MNNALLIIAAALLAVGCTPKIGIIRAHPAAVNIAPAKRVVVTVTGRDYNAGEQPLQVGALLVSQQRNDPDYPVRSLQNSMNRSFQGGYFTLTTAENAQCGIALKVTDWNHGEEEYTPPTTKENPHPATSIKVVGHVDAQATIACGHLGAAPIIRTYSVRRELQTGKQITTIEDHEKLLDMEINALTVNVVNEITPATYGEEVELDDSDDVCEAAVERLKAGDWDNAYALFEGVIKQYPTSAAAHYNLGVIEETRNEFDKAVAQYTEAKRLKSNGLYDVGIARAQRAKADSQALAGATAP